MKGEKSNQQLFREYKSAVHRYYSILTQRDGDIYYAQEEMGRIQEEILERMISPEVIKLEIK